ncbi:hypothetical protein GFC29_3675 [Anoxybacillus sp. B7M1]|jgi:hypothetical protein|uniref:Uncharacterized protein n=1 Tax=Anoxybacteroides rupiense TaxID=311460 RepID=A0ABD5IUB9_9BACL|nr:MULTISPECIES: hypothetical protein [Anoxybacillus]ANB57919.1 hypothetical protein GFC28_1759 [Anoxybacillus sp. B2M1]ANB65824.1 hypothetical protein GFC29_3675 [Anoxybacillus sp. B7M1]KXG10216.1 hypothetical protein AT864_01777 [Anoxybacillus sp. P3H1B]MBB3907437.1 hypothetical protein [Anoxybacillus rupiensis]MBS2770440.1 hypothetical protein [Anoxybacillus rupiensis]
MSEKFEKALRDIAKSKHEGHDQFIKRFEKWGQEFEQKIKEIEKMNGQFLKDIEGNIGYINSWFGKKGKQMERIFRNFKS